MGAITSNYIDLKPISVSEWVANLKREAFAVDTVFQAYHKAFMGPLPCSKALIIYTSPTNWRISSKNGHVFVPLELKQLNFFTKWFFHKSWWLRCSWKNHFDRHVSTENKFPLSICHTWSNSRAWIASTILRVSWPPREDFKTVPPRLWISLTTLGLREIVFRA